MDTMDQKSKILLAYELSQIKVYKRNIAKDLGIGKSTLYRWLDGIREAGGVKQFLEVYENAKKGTREKRKLDVFIKRDIWALREKNNQCCGQKIQRYLLKEKGIDIGKTTIYRVLKERYQLRARWKKNQARGHVPHAGKPREVIQMDTVDFGGIFAFTGIDIFSKEVDVLLSNKLTSSYALTFLRRAMARRFGGYAELIQTDGGPEFKQEFKKHVLEYTGRHRVARPYKKNEQSFIESFNRSLRKECLGWGKYRAPELPHLQAEVERYLVYYHSERVHCSLNYLTPLEFSVSHI